MPELPEVETTRRGIEPHVQGQQVKKVTVRQPVLRWPVPVALSRELPGRQIDAVARRGKYLVLATSSASKGSNDEDSHYLLIHLGMSGSLRLVAADAPVGKHDHVDIALRSGQVLRYTDPRRFGTLLWESGDPAQHPLLVNLGPEPLAPDFTDDWLYERARGRTVAGSESGRVRQPVKQSVKTFIMDSQVVVGVGNIYANEALFMAGIDPRRAAGRISAVRYRKLTEAIREVLQQAITMGGTTLRDFVGGTGKPGYFKQSLQVYGRGGEPCHRCGTLLKEIRLSQRSTVYCPRCQT